MNCSPPGSSVHGIFQARILEWVAISFSRGSSPPGIESSPGSPALQADPLPTELQGKPLEVDTENGIWRCTMFIRDQHLGRGGKQDQAQGADGL